MALHAVAVCLWLVAWQSTWTSRVAVGGGATSQAVVALVGAYCGFVADLGPKAVVEI